MSSHLVIWTFVMRKLKPLLLHTKTFLEEFNRLPRVVENGFGGVCYTKGNLHEGGDFTYFEHLNRTSLVRREMRV